MTHSHTTEGMLTYWADRCTQRADIMDIRIFWTVYRTEILTDKHIRRHSIQIAS